MANTRTHARRTSAPWWLSGDEQCLHCHQLYAYEIEVRCAECDQPSCPYCVTHHAERGIVCVACSEGCDEAEDVARG